MAASKSDLSNYDLYGDTRFGGSYYNPSIDTGRLNSGDVPTINSPMSEFGSQSQSGSGNESGMTGADVASLILAAAGTGANIYGSYKQDQMAKKQLAYEQEQAARSEERQREIDDENARVAARQELQTDEQNAFNRLLQQAALYKGTGG